MDQICCIMDVDGFSPRIWREDKRTYQTPFLIRELGYVKIDSSHTYLPKSFRFDLGGQIDPQSVIDSEKTLEHQSKMVNGMTLYPGPREVGVLPYSRLQDVVRDMYLGCKRPGAALVAYKGGQTESKLLESLEIPSVDLQLYGCPKYEHLVRSSRVFSEIRDCGYHKLTKVTPVHCPMAEVVAYRDWCVLNMKKFTAEALGSSREGVEGWSDEDSF